MAKFGRESHEQWSFSNGDKLDVVVTREPNPSHGWYYILMTFCILLMLAVTGILLYSGIKSATYPAELRAAAVRQDLGEIRRDLSDFVAGNAAPGTGNTSIQPTAAGYLSAICGNVILLVCLWIVGAVVIGNIRMVIGDD